MGCVLSMVVYHLDETTLVYAVLCALAERLVVVLDGTTLPPTGGQGARIVMFPLCVLNSVAFSGFVSISAYCRLDSIRRICFFSLVRCRVGSGISRLCIFSF